MKTDLLNLKTMEESLDWLIKDCAQQLFALTDLTENAKYPYMPTAAGAFKIFIPLSNAGPTE